MNQVKGFLLYLAIVTVVLIITAANWVLAKLQPGLRLLCRLRGRYRHQSEEEIGYESARPNDHKI